jgi:hypothetical protein
MRADEVADGDFRRFDSERRPAQGRVRQQPVDRAFEIAAVGTDRMRDKGEHGGGKLEARLERPRSSDARLQDLQTQRFVERTNLDAKAYAEA